MAKTPGNLDEAFAGESKASTTYFAFARKADQESYPGVARLFRAAVAAEQIHARNHLDAMAGIGSTEENLKNAIAGENMEHVKMYPEFIEAAQKEQQPKAERTFSWARQVEITHEGLYKAALEALQSKAPPKDFYVCQVCGHTAEGEAPDKCPVCGAARAQFKKVD